MFSKQWLALGLLCGLIFGAAARAQDIVVVSREDGSGTRGAFVELLGIEEKTAEGKKKDRTTKEAIIANQTAIVLQKVVGDENAIGYISLGSLNNAVKALAINGVAATADNVKAGTYKISRPFIIAVKGEASGVVRDFIDFILASEGQGIVAKSYIAVNDEAKNYSGAKPAGKIVIAGSSSVTPLMEKLKEGYEKFNPQAKLEIQQSDSTAGIQSVIAGTCDIGMSSRGLKPNELEKVNRTEIALDGLAVIVNPQNSVNNLTAEQVRDIFMGKITTWQELK